MRKGSGSGGSIAMLPSSMGARGSPPDPGLEHGGSRHELVGKGRHTGQIASQLYLSPHTVRDHVKAVFEKVGVCSRGVLVAKVFAEHYSPPLRPVPTAA